MNITAGDLHSDLLSLHPCVAHHLLHRSQCRSDGGFELSLRCTGPSAVHFVRARPFAAVLPGNSVAEEVFTTGLSQFLSLYNAALIGRLVLTW